MTIDSGKDVNLRPFVPGSNTTSTSHTWAAVTPPSVTRVDGKVLTDQQLADLTKRAETDAGASEKLAKVNGAVSNFAAGVRNEAIATLLDDDSNFIPNSLSALYNPTYHFRLFMTTEHELVQGAQTQNNLTETLDRIPQITIAESGVTAGFNITDVEIEQATGPGWRTRGSMMSGMTMTIVEPLGTSLVEQIMIAGQSLGISNFAKFWYYVELSFLGYDENGAIVSDPLNDMALSNGGRWIYQIAINDLKMHADEGGATYILSMVPYPQTGFADDGAGYVPDNISVTGRTVQGFLDSFATELTRAWSQRYAGEIYKIKIVAKAVQNDNGGLTDIGGLVLTQTEHDSVRGLSFNAPKEGDDNTLPGETLGGTTSTTPQAQIARGTSISDVMTFLYAHCEGVQQIMLDTSAPEKLEDGDDDESVNWRGKKYRVAMIPYIEPEVKVTGYDPITGNYIKEITYNIWGYRTFGANMSSSQYRLVRDNPDIGAQMVTALRDAGYLKKRYDYLFTGLNTEVTKFDLDFNFAFSAVLPALSGWRQNSDSVSVHEKVNPATRDAGSSLTTQRNETSVSPEKIKEQMDAVASDLQAAKDDLNKESDEQKKADIQARINNLRTKQVALVEPAKRIRAESDRLSRLQREQIENEPRLNRYAEDAVPVPIPFQISYTQGANETAQGSGFFQQWHRGASLTGALLNQVYSPLPGTLASITLDIRGDPYWLGHATLERRAMISNPALSTKPDQRPNFSEGDNTFALMFRFPKTIGDDGQMVFRSDDLFNGVYRVTGVKNTFSGGTFSQTLTAVKLELITLAQPKSATTTTNGADN
jgi:hypothetical protein